MAEKSTKRSVRARRMWIRLQDWYGDSLDQYGAIAPPDWADAIDALPDLEAERAVLSKIRTHHPTFPPRFPEFDAICREVRAAPAAAADPLHVRLLDWALQSGRYKPVLGESRRFVHHGGQICAFVAERPDGTVTRVTVEDYLSNTPQERLPC